MGPPTAMCLEGERARGGAVHPRPSGPLRVPARRISRRGDSSEFGRQPPIRKMTSAAYGVSQDLIAGGAAVGCPVSPFFASTARVGDLPGEERAHPARPDSASCAPLSVCVGIGPDCCPGPLTLSPPLTRSRSLSLDFSLYGISRRSNSAPCPLSTIRSISLRVTTPTGMPSGAPASTAACATA